MHIVINKLQEGRSYSINQTYTSDSSYNQLVEATIISPITLKGDYLWINEELIVRLNTQYEISAHCDLCGKPTTAHCECTINEIYTCDNAAYNNIDDSIDIEPLIRECIVLSLVRTVRCSKDCKGLCPICGQNLNEKTCDCNKNNIDESNPFGILKQLINTGGAKDGITKM